MWQRHLRAVVVVGLGSYFVLGPIRTQVLMEPESSSKAPWRPMSWHMYHSVGLDNCQGEFWAVRDGQRVDYTRREREKARPRLYGGGNGACASNPQPSCFDANRPTETAGIELGAFPFQNRPTFQQVVTLTQKLPR